MPALLLRPVVKQIVGKSCVIRAVIHAVIKVVRAERLDVDDLTVDPLFFYLLCGHALRDHMHVYALGVLAAPHVQGNDGVGVFIFKPIIKVIAQLPSLFKRMYLVGVVKSQSAV